MSLLRGQQGRRVPRVGRREQGAVSARLRGVVEPGNLSVADELIAPDFINHAASPGSNRGPESMRGSVAWARNAFPDLHFEIEELVAEGDIVAGRLTVSGTHEGSLMGEPPTGRSVRDNHMHFVRFRDGKAVEHWGVREDLGMMRQLGLVVVPGPRLLGRMLVHRAKKLRPRLRAGR
jgi:predicted ester cyclase